MYQAGKMSSILHCWKKTKIFLPPLHIKLGLTKNFVKAMDKEGEGFAYLRQKFPPVSDAKIKEGIFVGPQIRALFGDSVSTKKLIKFENRAWRAFQKVCKHFWAIRDHQTISRSWKNCWMHTKHCDAICLLKFIIISTVIMQFNIILPSTPRSSK
jgi:hypothetical protein